MQTGNPLVTHDDLQRLCAIAREAGEAIMDVYARDIAFTHKDDASPLTEADLRADAIICARLRAGWPQWAIVSEESAASQVAAPVPTFFLVDPLDGTKEFLKRNGEFTVNIALVHEGKAVAGVVFAPALQQMYFGAAAIGAWRETADATVRLNTTATDAAGQLRVIGSRSHGGEAVEAWIATLPRPATFVAAGSSLKFCRLAEGAADCYPRIGPTCQWDTAAAQAVLEAAGGAVLDPDGQPMRYGMDRPVLNRNFLAVACADMALPPLPAS